jgi:hypothetical protein
MGSRVNVKEDFGILKKITVYLNARSIQFSL